MTTTLLKRAPSLTTEPASEPETDILLSLIAKAKARRPHLTGHWQIDKNSQLYCEWQMEE